MAMTNDDYHYTIEIAAAENIYEIRADYYEGKCDSRACHDAQRICQALAPKNASGICVKRICKRRDEDGETDKMEKILFLKEEIVPIADWAIGEGL